MAKRFKKIFDGLISKKPNFRACARLRAGRRGQAALQAIIDRIDRIMLLEFLRTASIAREHLFS